jgi:hypothetical protein
MSNELLFAVSWSDGRIFPDHKKNCPPLEKGSREKRGWLVEKDPPWRFAPENLKSELALR